MTASAVPATIRLRLLSSVSFKSGLIINSSPILPILTAPTGPRKGIEEIVSVADAPIIPKISEIFSSRKKGQRG